ncbi:hypothetical protein E0493_02140 [Roseomonas sp. M0104]|uniref:Uncharacterized protein n=1 Tax=Teichococcus coralli TaxID=2545983 RepID=A0A845B4N8_9PROT|nr:hypothetical protein [Pseudoroseomonas coralli]MXP62151.1 hypothetical protein [Pseudoroseomonas coralli]
MSESVGEAAARLEQAVERLAAALAARPPQSAGVSPEAVAALSARLDETLERLRGALAEMEGAAAPQDPGFMTSESDAPDDSAMPDDVSSEES